MKINIGIVDDHQLFLKSLGLMLQTFDKYNVVVQAVNGEDLQRKMRILTDIPEILLVDVDMPVLDGIGTVKWLKINYPIIKPVALSVNNTDKVIIEMIKAGCCAYLLKDTHPDELEKALDEIYNKGYYNADVSNINFRRLLEYEQSQLKFTDREMVFLRYACSDLTYKEIAAKMFLSERTIDGYRESLFQKLNVQSRVGMALEAVRKGLVTI